ncbi:MAG: bacteriohopanetetrol glucosamine biosynthesis glycosyltransferase HpnI [Acidobacteria bacterium]|nr:bacteriohopanetetrol glucosamine biosynthesis glycosyltransferase HpnI [Acidobacteriota bacterium]
MAWISPLLLYYVPLTIAVGACLYQLGVMIAALRFLRETGPATEYTPPVSILKPLRGIEPNFYVTLSTFFRQQYPNYEIVFGLTDPKDPAHWTIAQLQRDFPQVPVRVVIVPGGTGTNPKMTKLQRMVEEAAHEVLVISDGDISVGPLYLRDVVRSLADERMGMVTCLYRGIPSGSLRSILEALGMGGEFAGQVLLARALRGMRFGLGATMATRKKQIAEIGGLSPWADYLADDYILGDRIAAAGYRIHLSHRPVDTLLPHRTWAELFQQQLRWARTIRACSPRGYPGLLFAYATPLALLPAMYHPTTLALAVLDGAFILRWIAAWAAGVLVCKDRLVRNYFWLIPLRDLLALVIWLLSFAGREIVWHQNRFRLEPDGRIKAVTNGK